MNEERLTRARILIVDDQEANVRVLQRILTRAGYEAPAGTTNPHEVVSLYETLGPDLILLDLIMPGLDGFAVLEQLATRIPRDSFVPILVLTGDASAAARQQALSMGAKDFLAKPFDTTEVLLRIRNLLETRVLHLLLQDENQMLERKVEDRSRELLKSQLEVIERLARAAEFRDDDTGRHTQRVGDIAARLAALFSLSDETVMVVRRAAPLHDVGKIGIPDRILLKPGKLTSEEFDVMKTHTTIGARILSGGDSVLMRTAERVAMWHHERWDGTGYPEALGETDIPIEARLVAVADFYDALTHDRPYRPAWVQKDVLAEIRAQRGRQFDPQVVDAFLQLELGT